MKKIYTCIVQQKNVRQPDKKQKENNKNETT